MKSEHRQVKYIHKYKTKTQLLRKLPIRSRFLK